MVYIVCMLYDCLTSSSHHLISLCRDLIGSDEDLLGVTKDLSYYSHGAIEANVPIQVAKCLEEYVPEGT